VNAPAKNRLVTRLDALVRSERRALAPYVTAGDGGVSRSVAVLRALDGAGAACVELGIPFSDPIADGPVLQAAADRALAQDTGFAQVLEILRRLRAGERDAAPSALPVVVMSYLNPLLRQGLDRALAELAHAGADAILVADVPIEEAADLESAARGAELAPIFFVSPTTSPERAARACRASRGYVYAIGRVGVTGAGANLGDEAQEFLQRTKRAAGSLPLAVGFGIASAFDVRAATRHADLAIVGSALVSAIHAAAPEPGREHDARAAAAAAGFLRELSKGLPS
jgi:tryptophan synthase alpha chain